ncbi:MAG: hypothetical protein KKF44_05020 [Nanoarchaeota archaeon]|nr:hypothetical protein [Nanoarchaeota archaeon]
MKTSRNSLFFVVFFVSILLASCNSDGEEKDKASILNPEFTITGPFMAHVGDTIEFHIEGEVPKDAQIKMATKTIIEDHTDIITITDFNDQVLKEDNNKIDSKFLYYVDPEIWLEDPYGESLVAEFVFDYSFPYNYEYGILDHRTMLDTNKKLYITKGKLNIEQIDHRSFRLRYTPHTVDETIKCRNNIEESNTPEYYLDQKKAKCSKIDFGYRLEVFFIPLNNNKAGKEIRLYEDYISLFGEMTMTDPEGISYFEEIVLLPPYVNPNIKSSYGMLRFVIRNQEDEEDHFEWKIDDQFLIAHSSDDFFEAQSSDQFPQVQSSEQLFETDSPIDITIEEEYEGQEYLILPRNKNFEIEHDNRYYNDFVVYIVSDELEVGDYLTIKVDIDDRSNTEEYPVYTSILTEEFSIDDVDETLKGMDDNNHKFFEIFKNVPREASMKFTSISVPLPQIKKPYSNAVISVYDERGLLGQTVTKLLSSEYYDDCREIRENERKLNYIDELNKDYPFNPLYDIEWQKGVPLAVVGQPTEFTFKNAELFWPITIINGQMYRSLDENSIIWKLRDRFFGYIAFRINDLLTLYKENQIELIETWEQKWKEQSAELRDYIDFLKKEVEENKLYFNSNQKENILQIEDIFTSLVEKDFPALFNENSDQTNTKNLENIFQKYDDISVLLESLKYIKFHGFPDYQAHFEPDAEGMAIQLLKTEVLSINDLMEYSLHFGHEYRERIEFALWSDDCNAQYMNPSNDCIEQRDFSDILYNYRAKENQPMLYLTKECIHFDRPNDYRPGELVTVTFDPNKVYSPDGETQRMCVEDLISEKYQFNFFALKHGRKDPHLNIRSEPIELSVVSATTYSFIVPIEFSFNDGTDGFGVSLTPIKDRYHILDQTMSLFEKTGVYYTSSIYNSDNTFGPRNLFDGKFGSCNDGEWMPQELVNEDNAEGILKIAADPNRKIEQILLYDRACPGQNVLAGHITLSGGKRLDFKELYPDGITPLPVRVNQYANWFTLVIDKATDKSTGIGEIQIVYYDDSTIDEADCLDHETPSECMQEIDSTSSIYSEEFSAENVFDGIYGKECNLGDWAADFKDHEPELRIKINPYMKLKSIKIIRSMCEDEPRGSILLSDGEEIGEFSLKDTEEFEVEVDRRGIIWATLRFDEIGIVRETLRMIETSIPELNRISEIILYYEDNDGNSYECIGNHMLPVVSSQVLNVVRN